MKDMREKWARPGGWRFWAILAAVWTLPWAVMGMHDVLTASALGQQGLAAGLSAHNVIQVIFVAAYAGVRWMGGMVLLGGVALLTEWPLRRGKSSA